MAGMPQAAEAAESMSNCCCGWGRVRRGDRRCPRRQTDPVQVATDRAGLVTAATIFRTAAFAYAQVKLEHSRQQYGPGQSCRRCDLALTAGVGRLVGRSQTRHDLCAIGGIGRQHAVVASEKASRERAMWQPQKWALIVMQEWVWELVSFLVCCSAL